MSKAFTRESDEAPNSDPGVRPAPVLPAGAPNYLTPTGAARLREELARLAETERPRLATSAGDDAPALRARDQRIAHLRRSLATAVVVPPPPTGEDRVRFGATVRVRDQAGHETAYRIVGVDETDLDRNWVSWISPVARALLNGRVGERVRVRLPMGEEHFQITAISYE